MTFDSVWVLAPPTGNLDLSYLDRVCFVAFSYVKMYHYELPQLSQRVSKVNTRSNSVD